MDGYILEHTMHLHKPAYIAGDTVTGDISVRSSTPLELLSLNLKFTGKGSALYFNAKYWAQTLCEDDIPSISVKEHCIEEGKVWVIPFSIKLKDDLGSSIDSGKKGRIRYYVTWELIGNVGEPSKKCQEITILANHNLDTLPHNNEITGNNSSEEEYDNMKLQLTSPASAYLPGEQIKFHAYAQNFGSKKPVKKIAVLLLQNVLFYKSACDADTKGRTRSFLMSVQEKSMSLKQGQEIEWDDEVQIPDPLAPSAAAGSHQINYELVLVAITKGQKSNIRAVFDKARYHFDLEQYQDDYFRDFLPHAHCDIQIGSHHGNKRSGCMGSGEPPIRAMNDIWKEYTGSKVSVEQNQKLSSQRTMARITFDPNTK